MEYPCTQTMPRGLVGYMLANMSKIMMYYKDDLDHKIYERELETDYQSEFWGNESELENDIEGEGCGNERELENEYEGEGCGNGSELENEYQAEGCGCASVRRLHYIIEKLGYIYADFFLWDYSFKRPDHQWDKRSALLIRRHSKLKNVHSKDNKKKLAKQYPQKVGGRKASAHENTFEVIQEYSRLMTKRVNGNHYHLGKKEDRMTFELMETIVRATTRIANVFIFDNGLLDIAEKLRAGPRATWTRQMFQSIVKFILHVFDLEDIMHIDNIMQLQKLGKEYTQLFQNLFGETKDDHHDIALSTYNAVNLIANSAKPLEGIHKLREHDVGEVLRQHFIYTQPQVDLAPISPAGCLVHPRLSSLRLKIQKKWARSALDSYQPLREEVKVHLDLELMRNKCFNVVDVLFAELLNSISFSELSEHLKFLWEYFVEQIAALVHRLLAFKQQLVQHFDAGTLFPLLCGIFLPCESDVIEVVRIANYERRRQSHRFISLRHMLSALSVTKFADHIENLSNFVSASEEIANRPLYRIYEAANCIALKSKAPKSKARKTKARKTKARKTKARKTKAPECDDEKILRLEHLVQAVTDEIRAISFSRMVPRFQMQSLPEDLNQLQQPTKSETNGWCSILSSREMSLLERREWDQLVKAFSNKPEACLL